MRISTSPPLEPRVLALLDGTAIVLFTVVGLVSHDGEVSGRSLLRDAIPLLVGWTTVALASGLYRKRTTTALIATWGLGMPLGVVIRGVILGRSPDGRQFAFLLTTLVFTAVIIAGLRMASSVLASAES